MYKSHCAMRPGDNCTIEKPLPAGRRQGLFKDPSVDLFLQLWPSHFQPPVCVVLFFFIAVRVTSAFRQSLTSFFLSFSLTHSFTHSLQTLCCSITSFGCIFYNLQFKFCSIAFSFCWHICVLSVFMVYSCKFFGSSVQLS